LNVEKPAQLRAVVASFVASVLAILAGSWLASRSATPPEPAAVAVAAAPVAVKAPAADVVPARLEAPLERGSDGIPIMPHEPTEAASEQPMHPHAHTEAHERIYRENNLVGHLNGAMDLKDGAAMRRLLERYRDEYPEDPSNLQQGYEIIANCLQRPGEDTRAEAERYWRERKSSILRRYVRRHCL